MALQTLYPANSAANVVAITMQTERARGVYIGASANYDFCFNKTTWVTFVGCVAGTVLPIAPWGVRNTVGGGAPAANAIIFLY